MMEFGPQLIGQTEKALNAVLRTELAQFSLSEPQWVTLRLAGQWGGEGDLGGFVARESHLGDADELVRGLQGAGLLDMSAHLTARGRDVVARVQRVITDTTGDIWTRVCPEDAAAAARALDVVREGYLDLLTR